MDNRETAWLILLALIFGSILWKTKDSTALHGVFRALTQSQIIYVLVSVACYIVICVWALSISGWWQLSNLKTTLLWTGSFAIVAVFNYEKIKSRKKYFRAVFAESIGIGAFLSFISSSHVFSLPIELAITCILIILSLISALSMTDEKLKPLGNLAITLLAILFLLTLSNSIYHIIAGFNEFATSHTAREFALPILLTVMFIPFLYGLYIYSTYEQVFQGLNSLVKNPILRKKTRKKLIIRFLFDTAGLEKWRHHIALFEPNDESDIDSSIVEIRKVRKREKNPCLVHPAVGWSPYKAIGFLSSVNLPTNDYHRTPIGWCASSQYLDLDKELIPNNTAYYIEGEEFAVLKLKLVLNVNSPEVASKAHEIFTQIVTLLIRFSIPDELQQDIVPNIEIDAPQRVRNYGLSLKHESWPNSTRGGYELVFTIETKGAME